MKIKDIGVGVFELVVFYALIYLWIYTIKYDVNLYLNSFILLVLFIVLIAGISLFSNETLKKMAI